MLGMQPRRMQRPPISGAPSTQIVRNPNLAPSEAAPNPALPPPITAKSNSVMTRHLKMYPSGMYYFSNFLHSLFALSAYRRILYNWVASLNIAQKLEEDRYILIFSLLAKGSPTF